MKQVFFIHGGEPFVSRNAFLDHLRSNALNNPHGYKEKRWTDSFCEDLGGGFEVFTPQMPNKQNANYEEWKIWFSRHLEFLRDDVIFVGWSLGGIFLMKYLAENNLTLKIRALVCLAAPFAGEALSDEVGRTTQDFVTDCERLDLVRKKVHQIIIMHARDDFVVPYKHALQYIEVFPKAILRSFEDKNHFLIEEFPELIQLIKQL